MGGVAEGSDSTETTTSEVLEETGTCPADMDDQLNSMCKIYVGSDLDTFISCVNSSEAGITISHSNGASSVSFTSNGNTYVSNLNISSLLCGADYTSLAPKTNGNNVCCNDVENVSETLATSIMKLNSCANNKIKDAVQAEIDKMSYFKRKCAQASFDNWNTESGLIHSAIADELEKSLNKACSACN